MKPQIQMAINRLKLSVKAENLADLKIITDALEECSVEDSVLELKQKAAIYDMLREDYDLKGSLVDFVDSQAKRIAELETICAESYQVVGALADAAGVFETSDAVSKALDNLSDAKLVHEDVLPFAVEARTVSLNPDPFGFARRSGDLVIIDVNGDPHIKDGMPLYAALLSPSVTCSVCGGSGRLHEPNEEPGDCSLCNGTGLLAAGIKLEVGE